MFNVEALKRYLELNYNVLFIGLHGIGKTAIVKEVFESAGLKWKYWSAPTLDPWVDFVGVPRVVENGDARELELVRPGFIQNDECDAFFFDELNRAPDKVLNAIMELIQFKTINGHHLKRLKVIWAAINPEDDDDTYSVNHLDPAQIDRFQVQLRLPYKIDEEYFTKKYPTVGNYFITWWKDLPDEIKRTVSPRRLDYAADAFLNKCRLEDVLPPESNVSALRTLLKTIPFQEKIKKIDSPEAAEELLRDINSATKLLDLIKANDSTAIDFFAKYGISLPKELIEPYAEFVYAQKKGFTVFRSLEEFIEKIPGDKGNQGTAGLINNVQLNLLYKNGGSLETDLRDLKSLKPNLINKLANRITDVIVTCRVPTLMRIFWGLEGLNKGIPSNFQTLTKAVGALGVFTSSQTRYINEKLFSNRIVNNDTFIVPF